jgi:Flp pilus assembly protein TadD
MKLGAIDFLSKPIKPEVLRRVVADVLDRPPTSARRSEPVLSPMSQAGSQAGVAVAAPAALAPAKRALNQRDFVRARELLEETLELSPDSAEAHNLMGVLRETLGQDRAAYDAYRMALEADPSYGPALANMRRYCQRAGLDFSNWSINPGAE